MSLRLEMLQVARLAPRQLGESRDLVAAFLRARCNPDGGFQDRAGASDLYYTVFGLDALIALQEDLPADRTAAYLTAQASAADFDFVHAACATSFKFLHGRIMNACEDATYQKCVAAFKADGRLRSAVSAIAREKEFCR